MRIAALACVCALGIALPAAAQDADIVGAWTVNVTLQSGPMPPSTLTLETDGAKIVGAYSGQSGDIPVEASVKERAVTIWFTVPTRNGPTAVTMKGSVDGDSMKGSADLGGNGTADWTAKRANAARSVPMAGAETRVDVTGAWEMAVETGAGSGTPTFVLKQDGENLTGQYTGQLGEAPVTGTVKGTAIEIAYDISVQGTALHIVYAGNVDGASMKGKVTLGELGEGTFTGKKK
jgi:hypothetical protein